MAALASLSWLLFLRVSEAVSIMPAGLGGDSVVLFFTTKVGGHREVRRPLYEWGRSGAGSSDATPRPAASLKVNRWLGEGLRQWRGSSHTSSVIPHIVATDGIPCGGGGAAAAFHCSPNVAYFVSWGRWKRLATALEYALGYSDPAVVGALLLPWPVGGQASDERLAVLLAALWGNPMYASPERKSTKATMEISVPVPWGSVVSLPDKDVATNRKEVDGVVSDSDSSSVP